MNIVLERITFYLSVAYNEVAALNKQHAIECVQLFRPTETPGLRPSCRALSFASKYAGAHLPPLKLLNKVSHVLNDQNTGAC